jgi:hypothetical protein
MEELRLRSNAAVLAQLSEIGKLTRRMKCAAADFIFLFDAAQFHDDLRAVDYARPKVDAKGRYRLLDDVPRPVDDARKAVWAAIKAVGGPRSAAGVVLWDCLGLGSPLGGRATALFAALSRLVNHFENGVT